MFTAGFYFMIFMILANIAMATLVVLALRNLRGIQKDLNEQRKHNRPKE